jgi:hypothetical protein
MGEDLLLKNISYLPQEIINIIKEYIPKTTWVFLTKTHYLLYHKLIKKHITCYESYIRFTIKKDNNFVFERIFEENYKIWLNKYNYKYQNILFKNYFFFIIDYCVDNGSNRCKQIIDNFLKEHGLWKNLHKKNIIKYIKWKN